ncbi:MAG: 3-hydroxybutyryl-CoA dehydrogenase [Candidatus Heimdallarchaeota archaeon]|nr:3-hydroxybutyryl-CoA dehydrogenase [Candidatus Heimdallarchaeota archaeon]
MTREVNKILVIGLGTMGNGIAHAAAAAGYEIHAFEIKQEYLDRGLNTIKQNLAREVKKNKITQEDMDASIARINGFIDLDLACKDVDFVIEAVFEDIKVKIELYDQLRQLLPEDVIIATNTSTISISLLAGGAQRGERFIGMHFFNPVPMMALCEIIRGLDTSDETLSITREIAEKMGKRVVIAKDSPGFIVNRIFIPLINEAVFAYAEGVGTAEDIDVAIKLGLGHPMGPLTLLDLIGLDTALHVSTSFFEAYGDSKYRVPPLLRQMVASGKLGRKSGEGFYKY